MKEYHIRETSLNDLDFLVQLEKQCFPAHRRSSRRSLKNSISSNTQQVYVLEVNTSSRETVSAGSATVFFFKHSLRLYSIAIHPDYKGRGLGKVLLQHVVDSAVRRGFEKITLEVDSDDKTLVTWYRKSGFKKTRVIKDYYGPGESAFRMVKNLDEAHSGLSIIDNIIVTDNMKWKDLALDGVEIVLAREYLSADRFRFYDRFNVLNLCSSYRTHTLGYYVSLLASARNHRIVPAVMTMKDIANISIAQSLLDEIRDFIQARLKTVEETTFELAVILGSTPRKEYTDVARKLFRLFEVPFFHIVLVRKDCWKIKKLSTLNVSTVLKQYPEEFHDSISKYFQGKRHRRPQLKQYKYDLAILVNNEEKTPPSCPVALDKFRRAGERAGFFVEFISKIDYQRICEFDALFIRETTAIENHTYRFARNAYTEGLVVIDDPWSILYCSNKIYLYERLVRGRIRQPKSWMLTKNALNNDMLKMLVYPLVLKLPESTFSLGVYRVNTVEELQEKLKVMFMQNDLVIAQEFLRSEFDWRIGVLDNTPLFACKYYMAEGHWQIYNWEHDSQSQFSGNSETLPLDKVPPHIIKTALRASSMIGDGLYGVDLKDMNGKAYVIEINDNPNIDAGIEDQVMQDELYMRIMTSFFNRIERERKQPRYLI